MHLQQMHTINSNPSIPKVDNLEITGKDVSIDYLSKTNYTFIALCR